MKRKVLFLALAALFCLFTVRAQDQSSIHSLMDFETMEYIGNLAHPAHDVLDAEYVSGTSDYIDINIKFSSLMRTYWEPYRINLKQYNGVTYVYNIVRTREVSIYEPFQLLSLRFLYSEVALCYPKISFIAKYLGFSDNDEAIRILYGTSEKDLTNAQRAAILLMDYLYGEDD